MSKTVICCRFSQGCIAYARNYGSWKNGAKLLQKMQNYCRKCCNDTENFAKKPEQIHKKRAFLKNKSSFLPVFGKNHNIFYLPSNI